MRIGIAALLALCVMNGVTRADLRLPTLFGDHAVLQRDKPLPVWGWADAGAAVDIELDGHRVNAAADEKGAWRANLPAMKAGGPFELKVSSAGNTRTLRDIWVGEVWLCSGQSNMAHPMSECENAKEDAAASDYPQLRTFRVREAVGDEPWDDAPGASWTACSPGTAGAFSAFAYYVGRKLHKETKVPVGLVVCAWGGSSVSAWMSRAALNQPAIRRQVPHDVFGWREPTRPNKLYCGMLHGLAPFAVRGVVWYQGETDAELPYNAYLYRDFLPAMIADWRSLWGEPQLPFYLVQLPVLKTRDWTVLRESQDRASRLPHAGMITTIDISRPMSLHPLNKHESGERMADLLLAEQYGQARPAYGPRYVKHAIDGQAVRIELERAAGLSTSDGEPPRGFSIAGDDRKFVDAEGKLDGATIVVSSASVPKPVAVRYSWSNEPKVNIVNDQKLPLAPFRTDDWPVAGQEDKWVAPPAKAELPRQVSGADVTKTWESAGADLKPETIQSRKLLRPIGADAMQVAVPDRAVEPGGPRSPRMLWRSPADALRTHDVSKGFTAEVKAAVFSSTAPLSGLELHVQLSYPDGRAKRYRIAIAPGRVFALHDHEVRVIGYNLNTSGPHAYRVVVRPEGSAQIYFDSRELGTLPGEWNEKPDPARSFVAIGKPFEGGTFTATIERVSFDAEGAYQP
jgi:sialate O-acetylesterase